jgi:hypothetical protein
VPSAVVRTSDAAGKDTTCCDMPGRMLASSDDDPPHDSVTAPWSRPDMPLTRKPAVLHIRTGLRRAQVKRPEAERLLRRLRVDR